MNKSILILALVLALSFAVSAELATFTIATDAAGKANHTEAVPFGTFKLTEFSSTHSFSSVGVKMDGSTIFSGAVAASQPYKVIGTSKSSVVFECSGGPASTTVTISVDQTWTSFRAFESTSSRDTEAFQLTNDAAGNSTYTEAVPFGTFKLTSFSTNGDYGDVLVTLDGKQAFKGKVVAGKSYSAGGSAKSEVKFVATGGTPGAVVTNTVVYTWSAFGFDNPVIHPWKFSETTDSHGNATIRERLDIQENRVVVVGFRSNMDLAGLVMIVDGTPVFPTNAHETGVASGRFYALNLDLVRGEHHLDIFAADGRPCAEFELSLYNR